MPRIFLAVELAEIRKGFDGLSQLIRDAIAQHPLSAQLYVFRKRRRDRIKVLYRLFAKCKHCGVEPSAYLRNVLERMSAHPHSRLEELLLDRWKPASAAESPD